jgi:hypothetical protein
VAKSPKIKKQRKATAMAQINATVTGASRSSSMTWDGNMVSMSNGSASFPTSAGLHVYAIVVAGSPGDPWTAKVTDGTTTQNHAGHMSPAGFDTTGDTPFQAS